MNFGATNEPGSFETHAVRIFRALELEVLGGKFQPGQKLARKDLGQRFGVSQATISEALWRLESEGLAESAPMYGTRVALMTPARIQDELVMREALECQVARLAAKKIQANDVTRIGQLADMVDETMRRSRSYSLDDMRTHQEFHLALAKLTGSSLLIREVERLWHRHFLFFTWASERVWPSPDHWHRTLLDAIVTHNADTAERAMRTHVRHGAHHQLQSLEEIQRSAQEGLAADPSRGKARPRARKSR